MNWRLPIAKPEAGHAPARRPQPAARKGLVAVKASLFSIAYTKEQVKQLWSRQAAASTSFIADVAGKSARAAESEGANSTSGPQHEHVLFAIDARNYDRALLWKA